MFTSFRYFPHLPRSLTGMWDTTDMKPGEEREVIVRTSLRELIIYLLFLVILCIGKWVLEELSLNLKRR